MIVCQTIINGGSVTNTEILLFFFFFLIIEIVLCFCFFGKITGNCRCRDSIQWNSRRIKSIREDLLLVL